MKPFVIGDNGVSTGLPFRRTKNKHYGFNVGDHGMVWVSAKLAELSGPDKVVMSGTPKVGINGNVAITSHIDPNTADAALLFLRLTAEPARKRVTYDLDRQQIILQRPVVRQFGKSTHRWHEVLAWIRPGQKVRARILCTFPEMVIPPFVIEYDGRNVVCEQMPYLSGPAKEGGTSDA